MEFASLGRRWDEGRYDSRKVDQSEAIFRRLNTIIVRSVLLVATWRGHMQLRLNRTAPHQEAKERCQYESI